MQIPKIIHQIWVGSKVIPEKYLKYCDSWIKCNPGWEYKLWQDNDIKKLFKKTLPETKHWYDADINVVMKCDIIRYELLRLFGGFYADLDTECLKPLDCFLEDKFVCGWEWLGEPKSISTGFLGSIANHQISLAMLYHIYSSLYTKIPTTKWDQLLACGPHAIINIVMTKGITPYPQKYFAPIPPLATAKEYYTDIKDAYIKHYFYGGQPGGWPEYYGKNEKEANPPVVISAVTKQGVNEINIRPRLSFPVLISTPEGKKIAHNAEQELELRRA